MTLTIFQKPFWLDAVAPDKWGVAQVERGTDVQGFMPYVLSEDNKHIVMPPLTQTLGPWMKPFESKYVKQLSREFELMTQLVTLLPEFKTFDQKFHYSISNWLPFYWMGFSQTTRYTYVIEDLSDLNAIWRGTRESVKNKIRKARKLMAIRNDLGLSSFLRLNEMVFKRQGKRVPYGNDVVERIYEACNMNNCGQMLFAEGPHGELHGAVYIVWDEHSAYYLLSGSDPELRSSGALSFLVWEAIQFAATVTRCFDFEGSMMRPVEGFVRGFGGIQKPYLHISKTESLLLKVRQDVRSWIKML